MNDSVKNMFSSKKNTTEDFWALKDINFTIKRGENIGIIGRNGAGKSTLLKVISRITEPTSGKVKIYGNVASLLEVGAGFHPELSGRENIYMNGAILGMTRSEISRKFDEIVEFSEIGQFLDTPVKRYSSGMYVRLAFSVSAHLESDIMIVDEVLSVGDAKFQKKCLDKMSTIGRNGSTVIFVSHNMSVIKNFCSKGMLIEQGRLKMVDEIDTIVDEYSRSVETNIQSLIGERIDRSGNRKVKMTKISFYNSNMVEINTIYSGQTLIIGIEYESTPYLRQGQTLEVILSFMNLYNVGLVSLSNKYTNTGLKSKKNDVIFCKVEKWPFNVGAFFFNAALKLDGEWADRVDNAGRIDVSAGDFFGSGIAPTEGSTILVESEWWQ